MNKGTCNELSATARAALTAAGFTVNRNKLESTGGGTSLDDLVGGAVLGWAVMLSGLESGKTEKGMREGIAAALEDLKAEIDEVQRALAPGVIF